METEPDHFFYVLRTKPPGRPVDLGGLNWASKYPQYPKSLFQALPLHASRVLTSLASSIERHSDSLHSLGIRLLVSPQIDVVPPLSPYHSGTTKTGQQAPPPANMCQVSQCNEMVSIFSAIVIRNTF